jgi:ABC-type sugar transport system permease subunit
MAVKLLKRERKPLSLERKIQRTGFYFLLPWLFGVITLFLVPFIQTVTWSFMNSDQSAWEGLGNYNYALLEHTRGHLSFTRNLWEVIPQTLLNTIIILVFSFFIALILNQKFRGRAVARALFFLPVIVASSIVINIIQGDVFTSRMMSSDNASMFQTGQIRALLFQIMPPDVAMVITDALSNIFDLVWKSGIQIILFLSGLQAIPATYYEVSSIEGANAWDNFWKITAPMVTPSILLVTVYSIIDSFTDNTNRLMMDIETEVRNKLEYGYASAMSIIFFIVIGVILLFIFWLSRRMVFYND